MRRNTIGASVAAMIVGVASGVVLGQTNASDEVRALHEIYYQYFADGRADLIAERIYHPNRMTFGTDGVTISEGQDAVQAGFTRATEALSAQGYDHSELRNPAICTPNPGTTIISGLFRRYRTDGSILAELGQTYVYAKTDEGWKIHATIAHGPDTVIGC